MSIKYYSIYKDDDLYANIRINNDYFVDGYLFDNQYYSSGYLDFNDNLYVYIVKDAFNNYCNAFYIENFKSKNSKMYELHLGEELEPISSSLINSKIKIKHVKEIKHFDDILDNSIRMLFKPENKLLYKIKVKKFMVLKKYFNDISLKDIKENQIKSIKKSYKKTMN